MEHKLDQRHSCCELSTATCELLTSASRETLAQHFPISRRPNNVCWYERRDTGGRMRTSPVPKEELLGTVIRATGKLQPSGSPGCVPGGDCVGKTAWVLHISCRGCAPTRMNAQLDQNGWAVLSKAHSLFSRTTGQPFKCLTPASALPVHFVCIPQETNKESGYLWLHS